MGGMLVPIETDIIGLLRRESHENRLLRLKAGCGKAFRLCIYWATVFLLKK